MAEKPELIFNLPWWHVVVRKEWLAGADTPSILINTGDVGLVPAFLTDEHQAVRFLDDANKPDWCTILVRTDGELLKYLQSFKEAGIENVGIDFNYPNGPHHGPGGWFVTTEHLIRCVTDKIRGH